MKIIKTKDNKYCLRHKNLPVNRDSKFPSYTYKKHRGIEEDDSELVKNTLKFMTIKPEVPRYMRAPTGIPKIIYYYVFQALSDFGM